MSDSYSNFYESSNLFHGAMMHVMGTRLDALILHPDKNVSMQCWIEIETEIFRLSKIFNKFDKESELYAVNRQAVHSPVSVKDELWSVLVDCRQYHAMTLGYFDISLKDFNQVLLDSKRHTVFFSGSGYSIGSGCLCQRVCIREDQGYPTAERYQLRIDKFW